MEWPTPAATSRHSRAVAICPFCACAPATAHSPSRRRKRVDAGAAARFLSFALEKDLRFDPAFLRHIPLIGEVLDRFKPDLIHITGPSEVGMLGARLAYEMELPLAASWHTNVHEYLARRSDWFVKLLPRQSVVTEQTIEDLTMAAAAKFYSMAQVLYAPNAELCALLKRDGRPCHLMPRGVDADLFHPAKRKREPNDRDHVLGFVGRLSVEKNVALLVQVQEELEAMGHRAFVS
jgi:phosphatidylinositol alpha 1,6-mannosyltransferase